MALYTVPEERWQEILRLSKQIQDGRKEIQDAWEKLAEELDFVAPTVSVVDEEKGVIDAEPRPSDEYIRQRRLLLVTDALHSLAAEDRDLARKLADVDPKIDLAQQLELVQEGADAADAIQAEPMPIEESEGIIVDGKVVPTEEGLKN